MVTTSQIRTWWGGACKPIGPALVPAYRALDACLVAHKYKLRQADTGAYNCRKITGGSGYSLHAYGPGHKFTFTSGVTVTTAVAVDCNWSTNPYGRTLVTDMPPAMVAAIKAIRTTNGKRVWRWGGDYVGNKDAMHFEVVCHPADLATGIDPDSLPLATTPPVTATSEETDVPHYIVKKPGSSQMWVTDGIVKRLVNDATEALILHGAGVGQLNASNDPFEWPATVVDDLHTLSRG